MSKQEFFPKKSAATPTIYVYELPKDGSRKGQLKIGFKNRTASKRLKRITKNSYDKVSDGNRIAQIIGLHTIRAKCYYFNNWITQLEYL